MWLTVPHGSQEELKSMITDSFKPKFDESYRKFSGIKEVLRLF